MSNDQEYSSISWLRHLKSSSACLQCLYFGDCKLMHMAKTLKVHWALQGIATYRKLFEAPGTWQWPSWRTVLGYIYTCPDCVRWGRIELQRLPFTTLLQHSSCVQKWAILWLCTDSHDRWEKVVEPSDSNHQVCHYRERLETPVVSANWVTGGPNTSEHADKAAACLRLICSPCLHLRIAPNKCPFGAKLPLACLF